MRPGPEMACQQEIITMATHGRKKALSISGQGFSVKRHRSRSEPHLLNKLQLQIRASEKTSHPVKHVATDDYLTFMDSKKLRYFKS